MPEHPDRFEVGARLRARVNEVGAQFLLTELHTGHTLLDLAETSVSDEDTQRRRALALEAYEVVADRLARNPNVVHLTNDEKATISQLLQELGNRLGR